MGNCCLSSTADNLAEYIEYVEYDSLNRLNETDFFNKLQFYQSLCIDAQSLSNYQQCHIKYSLNIPFEEKQPTKDSDIALPIAEAKNNLSLCKTIWSNY